MAENEPTFEYPYEDDGSIDELYLGKLRQDLSRLEAADQAELVACEHMQDGEMGFEIWSLQEDETVVITGDMFSYPGATADRPFTLFIEGTVASNIEIETIYNRSRQLSNRDSRNI